MASQIDIVNMALVKLGQNTITSLTENSVAAQSMSAMYDLERKALLRQYRWSFSISRAQLAALTDTPAFQYSYQYQLPTDCLQVIRLFEGEPDPNWPDFDQFPERAYKVEGRKILTDYEAPVYLVYVSDVDESGNFDSAFVAALADRLAYVTCNRITQSTTLKKSIKDDFRTSISFAIRSNAIELPSERQADTSWSLCRL